MSNSAAEAAKGASLALEAQKAEAEGTPETWSKRPKQRKLIRCRKCVCAFFLLANVLQLKKDGNIEALKCLPALNPPVADTKRHLSTEPAFLPNAC